MGFADSAFKFLKVPTKKDFEQLQEKIATQELLLKTSESNNEAIPETFVSSQAQESQTIQDIAGLVGKRVKPNSLQQLYLNNQFIFRGVNVRADETVTRGYEIVGGDEEGRTLCDELLENSGGVNLIRQYSINTDVSGNGYMEKVRNKKGNKILLLKHLNSVNFGYYLDPETNKIVFGADGTPVAYQQVFYKQSEKQRFYHQLIIFYYFLPYII